MKLLSILDVMNNFDFTFYIIIFVLLAMSIIMFYFIYTQNKQLSEEMHKRVITKSLKDTQEVPILKKDNQEEIENLQALTKELEVIPREKRIEMTPYEEEQEKKAIISYDELLKRNNNVSINYSDMKQDEDIIVKQVDLANTGKIELDPIKREINSRVNILGFEHEEEFLNNLKQLQNMLD